MSERSVECGEHGEQEETFVCQHLAGSLETSQPTGFFWSSRPDGSRGDAWCSACEAERIRCGGDWNEESEGFAQIQLLCGSCYDRIKALNGF